LARAGEWWFGGGMNNEVTELKESEQVVRIGKRAYRVRTQVVVEEVDCEQEGSGVVEERSDGCFELMMSEQDGCSIDKSERAVLMASWPAMRKAVAEHLRAVSKKKPKTR
jgi:hypothetical protein